MLKDTEDGPTMKQDKGIFGSEGGTLEARALAELVLATALEKKAIDPLILDVADLVGYADYFVVVSAKNTRQVRAIAEEVRRHMKDEHGLFPKGVEGMSTSKWVLVDYDDVVLHVFHEGARVFYDLEGLWADAPRLPVPKVQEVEEEAPFFSLT